MKKLLIILVLLFPLSALGSSIISCAGFLPHPCAPQDTNPRSYSPSLPTFGPTGGVGVPFINDFGEREARLTDRTMECGGSPVGTAFIPNSSSEVQSLSSFVPSLYGGDGGYYGTMHPVGGGAGGVCIYAFDSKTLSQFNIIDGATGSFPHGFTNGFQANSNPLICGGGSQSGCTWSRATPTKIYSTSSVTQLKSYDLANDAAGQSATIFDFSTCPNLPAFSGTYVTEMAVGGPASSPDRYFMLSWGGTGQGAPTLVADYDSSNGKCFWLDTQHATVGGTGMTSTPMSGFSTLAAPTCSATTSNTGTLANGTYYFTCTESTALGINNANGQTQGETTSPAIQSVIINNGTNNTGSIQVSFTAAANPESLVVRGCNAYIGTVNALASLWLQSPATGGAWPSCSGSYTQTAALATTGQNPPTVSGAGFNIHNAQFAPDGSYVRVDYQSGNGTLVWQGETNTATVYWNPGGANGHLANGYAVIANNRHTGIANDPAWAIGSIFGTANSADTRIWAAPNGLTLTSSDGHLAWNFNAPGDTIPFLGSMNKTTVSTGDGTQGWSNPASKSTSPFDEEIDAILPSGTVNQLWRFALTRGAYLQNPHDTQQFYNYALFAETPDGKFIVFGSNWGWYLGSAWNTTPACPAATSFCASDLFVVEAK